MRFFTQHGPEEFKQRLLRGGEAHEPARTQAFAHSHSHDQSVTSVGIVNDAPLDLKRFCAWMSTLLRTKGIDIFRMKGILNLKGTAERFVFQARRAVGGRH